MCGCGTQDAQMISTTTDGRLGRYVEGEDLKTKPERRSSPWPSLADA